MSPDVPLQSVWTPSEDVVAREIEGELILVPIVAGIGDCEDAIFTLNETGRDVWQRLDGVRTLAQVAAELASEYDAPSAQIETDVTGLVAELCQRRMLIKK